MGSDRLEKLLVQREAIEARIRREHAKSRTQERKADTRRKILAGAAVLDRADKDAAFKAELQALLVGFLTRTDDRALFGLPPIPDATIAASSTPIAEIGDRAAA